MRPNSKLSASRKKIIQNPAYQKLTKEYPELQKFLKEINLERYTDIFIIHEITELNTIKLLEDKHFQNMKIPIGHKLKILKHIKELKESEIKDMSGDPKPNLDFKISNETFQKSNSFEEKLEKIKTASSINDSKATSLYDCSTFNDINLKEKSQNQEQLKVDEEEKKIMKVPIKNENVLIINENDPLKFENIWTKMSPLSNDLSHVISKEFCWNCLKMINKKKMVISIEKCFCSLPCSQEYIKLNSISCRECSKNCLKQKAFLINAYWFCSEICSIIYQKKHNNMNNVSISKPKNSIQKKASLIPVNSSISEEEVEKLSIELLDINI